VLRIGFEADPEDSVAGVSTSPSYWAWIETQFLILWILAPALVVGAGGNAGLGEFRLPFYF
jgi:hypothetical protein